MCIFSGNFDSIIFSGISALLILQFWSHIDYNNEQFVSAFPLKLYVAWNLEKLCLNLGHNV